MATDKLDFYQLLRQRVRVWFEEKGKSVRHAELLLLAPDLAHVIAKLVLDKEVPLSEKARLAGALAYFLSPIDLIPDVIGIPGYFDDIVLAAYVLNGLINAGYGAVAERHWAGDGQLLVNIQRVLASTSEILGSKTWEKLRRRVDGSSQPPRS